MATGFGGTYKGTVVDNVDPLSENRLLVIVSEVSSETTWAKPVDTSFSGQLPAVGKEVVVQYEGGDSDYPVWQSSGTSAAGAGGHDGVYMATVVNNADPQGANRLEVTVPDVLGSEPAWATPSDPSVSALPGVGATVYVRFDGGNVDHPIWQSQQ